LIPVRGSALCKALFFNSSAAYCQAINQEDDPVHHASHNSTSETFESTLAMTNANPRARLPKQEFSRIPSQQREALCVARRTKKMLEKMLEPHISISQSTQITHSHE
jgi:hypothetical protein